MSSLRIYRYILKEISIPALLSLLIFTFVIVMGRIPRLIELVVNKGVPVAEMLQLFGFLLPYFFTITVPLSFLLGILLAFGRLSADSEFIALKASGISLYAMMKPVLMLALACSLLTAWLSISVGPSSKGAFRNKIFQIASSRATVGITPGVFNDDFDGIVLYASGMDEQRGIMQNVFISDEREGETPATILAQQGRFIPDPENYSITLRLNNGSIHRQPASQTKRTYQTISFTDYSINLDTGAQLSPTEGRKRSRSELNWTELSKVRNAEKDPKARRYLTVEQHRRISLAFAPLVLALVGVPLGLQSNRSGKGAGFALALAVALVYYLLLSIAKTIAGKGLGPAAASLWLPNICFLLGGGYFLHRAAIERPLKLLPQWKKILTRKAAKGQK